MSSRSLIVLAAGGSLALLLGALAFQHLGALAPCKLCIWQRYPHLAAAGIGAVAFFVPALWLLALGALAALGTAGVGFYHAGVENGLWEGPTSCSSGDIGSLSTDDLMEQIMSAPLVQCDQVAWSLAGISMAGWNGILSVVLACLWVIAATRK